MPRFKDAEREAIQTALLQEGERLFSMHGLKRVTVDDLSEAANISKGSFYAFYQSKEHLFMAISFRIQGRLFEELRQLLERNKALPPRELAAYSFKMLYVKSLEYPILANLDKPTMHHLLRKLPPELIAKHTRDEAAMVKMLEEYGIFFSEDAALVAKTLQTIFICANLLEGDKDNEKIVDILFDGVLSLLNTGSGEMRKLERQSSRVVQRARR